MQPLFQETTDPGNSACNCDKTTAMLNYKLLQNSHPLFRLFVGTVETGMTS